MTILQGDALTVLKTLPDESVQCCVTSPPYWGLRDYGVKGQLGLERTPEEYVGKMVEVFGEVRRVLREDGTLFCNLGDSYYASGPNRQSGLDGWAEGLKRDQRSPHQRVECGLKPKDLVGVPWMLAFALRADGWWLRQDIIWHKPNPMPESVTDRCTKSHEYIFLLTKSARYFYDAEAIKEQSVTGDERRPYTSAGAWELDGRPIEQRHGGKPRNGAKCLRGQGSNRDGENGPANRDNRDMAEVGVGQNRNKRSVWTIATDPYSEAHFATFPPDLIKPCILAGTSARGCCPECGAPWERMVDSVPATSKPCPKTLEAHLARGGIGEPVGTVGKSGSGRINGYSMTTGWTKRCNHYVDPIPCTVLDPFFGSGTTGMVALELGRKCIGIELNEDYIKLAEDRCNVTPGLALA